MPVITSFMVLSLVFRSWHLIPKGTNMRDEPYDHSKITPQKKWHEFGDSGDQTFPTTFPDDNGRTAPANGEDFNRRNHILPINKLNQNFKGSIRKTKFSTQNHPPRRLCSRGPGRHLESIRYMLHKIDLKVGEGKDKLNSTGKVEKTQFQRFW